MNIGGKNVPSWAVYSGVGAAVVGGVLFLHRKNAGTSSTASAPAAGAVDPNATDPNTGLTYGQEESAAQSLGSNGYSSGYGYDPSAGYSGLGYGSPTYVTGDGSVVGTAYTTNAQWSQAVEAGLTSLGYDSLAVGAALGKYLASLPLSADQVTIVQTAVAEYGPPPVGQFAIIPTPTSSGSGGTPPPSGGGTPPPSGGGTPPPAQSWSFPAPHGLTASSVSRTGFRLSWGPVTGPSGQHPASYTVATYQQNGKKVDEFTTSGTSTAEYGTGGKGLTPGYTYHTNVWANGGPGAPQHASITVTLHH